MTRIRRLSPESEQLLAAVGVLLIAYLAVHWRYYYEKFPRDVAAAVDIRRYTLAPKTPWGLVVRGLVLYMSYRAFKRLQAWWLKLQEKAEAARRLATHEAARGAMAAQMQQAASEAAAAVQAAKGRSQLMAAQEAEAGRRAREGAARELDAGRAAAQASRQQEVSSAAAAAAEASARAADSAAAARAAVAAAAAQGGGCAGSKQAWLERMQAQQNEAAAAAAAAAAATKAAAAAAAKADEASATAADEAATEDKPPVAIASAMAAARRESAASAAAVPITSSSSTATSGSGANGGGGSPLVRPKSGANMVSLQEAQEAEERQRQWMAQLSANPGLSPLQREAMQKERDLKAKQDAEYEAALEADRRRAEERAAAEAVAAAEAEAAAAAEAAAVEAAAERRLKVEEMRLRLRESLPTEPGRDDETAVLVRVRLSDGCSHTRRFPAEAPVQQIRHWLQSLDSFPLWEPERWSLVNSYPRRVLGGAADEGGETVSVIAAGSKQVALFVQENEECGKPKCRKMKCGSG